MDHVEWGPILSDLRRANEAIEGVPDRLKPIEASTSANTKSIDELYKITRRPSFGGSSDTISDFVRKDATEYCQVKHDLATPKNDGVSAEYVPSPSEIDNALLARKALRGLFRHGNVDRLDNLEKKSLTSFAFGSNQFFLTPEMSGRVISCIHDPTDVAGLMGQATTSTGSLKFFIDNQRMQIAGWACDASCFSNNPQPDLQEGLGEMEIKTESLRFIVCAGNDLLQDAQFNIENWILQKASQGFRDAINNAIIAGDGLGKPLGILNPNSGIPICDTSPATQPGQFTWQDLVMLKFEIPSRWHEGASFFMNQRTFALLLTMSDASSRPLFGQLPSGLPGYMFAGSPIQIVSQMPDVAPGATPIAFGNWKSAYIVVTRSGTMMRTDPFTAGWCTLFLFEARIGGSVACPNAARLLRIS
jgi:HK97 family phage major capsid protein